MVDGTVLGVVADTNHQVTERFRRRNRVTGDPICRHPISRPDKAPNSRHHDLYKYLCYFIASLVLISRPIYKMTAVHEVAQSGFGTGTNELYDR